MPSSKHRQATKLSDYTVLETVGTGSFGICTKVRRNVDGKMLVWKELDYGTMSEREKQMLVSEVNILREFRHPNIVRYYDRIIDRDNTKIYIVMEHCDGGDVAALLKQCRKQKCFLPEQKVWDIFVQTVIAMQACHRRKAGAVMHRDIKPANLFLDRHHNVKLGDFGLARVLTSTSSMARTFVGTPYYMSPEQVNKKGYNEKSDIWALGCILYEMAALTPPFNAEDEARLGVKINDGRFRRLASQYSDDLNDVIKLLLQNEASLRPSIGSILTHPLVQKHTSSRAVGTTAATSPTPNPHPTPLLSSSSSKAPATASPTYSSAGAAMAARTTPSTPATISDSGRGGSSAYAPQAYVNVTPTSRTKTPSSTAALAVSSAGSTAAANIKNIGIGLAAYTPPSGLTAAGGGAGVAAGQENTAAAARRTSTAAAAAADASRAHATAVATPATTPKIGNARWREESPALREYKDARPKWEVPLDYADSRTPVRDTTPSARSGTVPAWEPLSAAYGNGAATPGMVAGSTPSQSPSSRSPSMAAVPAATTAATSASSAAYEVSLKELEARLQQKSRQLELRARELDEREGGIRVREKRIKQRELVMEIRGNKHLGAAALSPSTAAPVSNVDAFGAPSSYQLPHQHRFHHASPNPSPSYAKPAHTYAMHTPPQHTATSTSQQYHFQPHMHAAPASKVQVQAQVPQRPASMSYTPSTQLAEFMLQYGNGNSNA